jgi:ribonuclease P protein subunit RPR2
VNRKKRTRKARDIAKERIERLFDLAYEEHALHPDRSDRYVQIARKISMRVRQRIPPPLKKKFCKHCGGYLAPEDMRVRLRKGVLTITCLRCGGRMRYPYWEKAGTAQKG